MKSTTIAIFLICLLSISQAANMRRNKRITPMDELRELSEKSAFSKNLYVTINLSLQSGGKVDEVIDFVKQARTEAQTERNELNKTYTSESARLTEEIEGLENELSVLNGQLDIVLENIDELTQEVNLLEGKLARLQGERSAIEERQQALDKARENDMAAFRSRQQRDQNAISALEQIIPALENLSENGSAFLQKSKKDIMMALQRIPENKPIQMLVELSTKFNQAKLQEVIQKLSAILESIQASKAQDEQSEEASNQRYQSLVFELQALWNAKSNEINVVKTDLNAKSQSLRHNNTFRDNLTANIEQTTNLRNATVSIFEQTTATYNANLAAANETIDALTAALQILTENEATLEAQEQTSGFDQEEANE